MILPVGRAVRKHGGRAGAGSDSEWNPGVGNARRCEAGVTWRQATNGRRPALRYVQTEADLEAITRVVRAAPLLAIDTEAAGYHRYHDRICLLQLSTRDATFVVDTLSIDGLDPLVPVLADPAIEILIHDADYDLRLLGRDYGIHVAGLFDTKVAAQFAGEPGIGLANLVEKYIGVRLDKKFQRADWAKRPLPADQLEYAAEDTRHLPALRDHLRAKLEELGRLAWAEEEFLLREELRPEPVTEDPDAYLRLKRIRDLGPRQLAALRALYNWRESVAADRDVAPFRVVGNEAIIAVARALPDSHAALGRVPGLAASIQSRRGDDMLAAVREARDLPADQLPSRPRGPGRPPPDPEFDARVDALKAVRDQFAQDLGLDRGFLMPRQQLETVARALPADPRALAALPDMRRWQVELLGDALIDALRRVR